MTNKDILKAFSGLDADTVIACAPGGAPQRKNRLVLRVVAIAACVALLVSAVVVSTLLLNREDENQPDVPSDVTEQGDQNQSDIPSQPTEPSNEKKKYEMYTSFSAGENSDVNISANENVEFKPIGEKNFNLFSSKNKIDRPENVSSILAARIGDISYSLNYSSAYTTAINNAQRFDSLGKYVKYESDDKEVRVEISAATKTIVYFDNGLAENKAIGNFTAEEAKQAAEALLCEMYGESFLDEYEYTKTNTTDDQRYKMHSVYYTRKIFGFDTEEYIFVDFNFKGELLLVNAKRKGMMAFAEEDFTKEDIEGAVSAVTEVFSDSWYIGNHEITLDSEGDYYLMTYLVHADGDKITEMRKVHTKIK